jgi:hypothetical protein
MIINKKINIFTNFIHTKHKIILKKKFNLICTIISELLKNSLDVR